MRSFWVLVPLALGGCSSSEGKARPRAPRPVPVCDQLVLDAQAARQAGGSEAAEAVFALAECKGARVAASAGGAELGETAALYDEAAQAAPGRWALGAAVRKGELYRAAGAADQALAAYQVAVGHAEAMPQELRMDVEVADWIKLACRQLASAGKPPTQVVCRPWGGAWR
jgi:tetratricopeptide (TPR) repeat protein